MPVIQTIVKPTKPYYHAKATSVRYKAINIPSKITTKQQENVDHC